MTLSGQGKSVTVTECHSKRVSSLPLLDPRELGVRVLGAGAVRVRVPFESANLTELHRLRILSANTWKISMINPVKILPSYSEQKGLCLPSEAKREKGYFDLCLGWDSGQERRRTETTAS